MVLLQDLRPGKLPSPLHRDELNLGDIFLGVEFVMKQCQEESLDFHGTLTVSAVLSVFSHCCMFLTKEILKVQCGALFDIWWLCCRVEKTRKTTKLGYIYNSSFPNISIV